MEISRKYLIVIDLAEANAVQGKALKAELDRISTVRPMLLFAATKRIGYLIQATIPERELLLDGVTRAGDSVLLIELGRMAGVEGYTLKDVATWIRGA